MKKMEDKETQNYFKKSGQKITYQTPPIGERKIILYLTTIDLEQKEEKQYIKINNLYSASQYINNYNSLNCTRYMHFGWQTNNNNNNNKMTTVTVVCHKTGRKGD